MAEKQTKAVRDGARKRRGGSLEERAVARPGGHTATARRAGVDERHVEDAGSSAEAIAESRHGVGGDGRGVGNRKRGGTARQETGKPGPRKKRRGG